MPSDGWPEVVEMLRLTEKPWPDAAVVTDLRWLVDARAMLLKQRSPTVKEAELDHALLRAAIPGRPTLTERWRWPDWRVRKFLADTERWWEANRFCQQESHQRPSSGPPAALQSDNGQTLLIEKDSPAALQRPSSGPPSRDPSSSQNTSTKGTKGSRKETPSTITDTKKQITDLWKEAWKLSGRTETYPWGGESGFRAAMRHAAAILDITGQPVDPARVLATMLMYVRDEWRRERKLPPTFDDFTKNFRVWWLKAGDAPRLPALPPDTPPAPPKPPPKHSPHVSEDFELFRPVVMPWPKRGPILKE